jgi:two-component system CheB/CheR fusion protein
MSANAKGGNATIEAIGPDFFEKSWDQSWTYIKTVVDVIHEPVLILNKELFVMAANQPFYDMFQVDAKATEGKHVYQLGNGQWDIPSLRKLLEDILPKNNFFKGFEVSHDFPVIGHKVMILNAREIHVTKTMSTQILPEIILLAIEDVTDMMNVAKKLADHTIRFEEELKTRTQTMATQIRQLEVEIYNLKIKVA